MWARESELPCRLIAITVPWTVVLEAPSQPERRGEGTEEEQAVGGCKRVTPGRHRAEPAREQLFLWRGARCWDCSAHGSRTKGLLPGAGDPSQQDGDRDTALKPWGCWGPGAIESPGCPPHGKLIPTPWDFVDQSKIQNDSWGQVRVSFLFCQIKTVKEMAI